MESNRATRKRNWSQRTLAGELARERLVFPGEERALAALEAAQVTREVREMVGNLVADIEAREANCVMRSKTCWRFSSRSGPARAARSSKPSRLLKTFQPDPCV